MRRRPDKSEVKYDGSTVKLPLKLSGLSSREVGGIPGVAVKSVNTWRNTGGEGGLLLDTDAQARKHGERTGLDTPVVHAVNDGY